MSEGNPTTIDAKCKCGATFHIQSAWCEEARRGLADFLEQHKKCLETPYVLSPSAPIWPVTPYAPPPRISPSDTPAYPPTYPTITCQDGTTEKPVQG